MFNTYVRPQPNYPQTVHNHLPPTADTVRLLRELQKEAQQNVLDTISFGLADNRISGKVVLLREWTTGLANKSVAVFSFTINGVSHQFKEEVDYLDFRLREVEVYKKLAAAAGMEIAKMLISQSPIAERVTR